MSLKSKLLFFSASFWYLGEGLLGPLFVVFANRVGGDLLEISGAWAAYLIVMGISSMVVGKLSDRGVSRERMLVIGYALNAVFTFCYLLVHNPFQLFLVQFGLGVASALATPTWNSLYSRLHHSHNDGFAWGAADGQADIISGIAILVGSLIVTLFSFEVLFLLMGSLQVIATLLTIPLVFNHWPNIHLRKPPHDE
jgi:MFS family permease